MDLEVSTGVVHSLIPYESHESVDFSEISHGVLRSMFCSCLMSAAEMQEQFL